MDLYVMSTSFDILAVVDDYKSLIWTDRYDAAGDFELYLSAYSESLAYLKPDNYLISPNSDRIMIIESIDLSSDVDSGSSATITGRSLESILDRRIVWNQTRIQGNLQNGIQGLLNDAIISPTDPNRKISNFSFQASTDPAVTGLNADAQFTGDDLLGAISDLCSAASIGFRITMPTVGQFLFQLYAGANRSYTQNANPFVVFSNKFENLLNSSYLRNKTPHKTVVLVGGEGEGGDRKFAPVGRATEQTGMERREIFKDARDLSSNVNGTDIPYHDYILMLMQRGYETLAEWTGVEMFEGEAASDNTMYVYGEDFYMGDIVQIANEYGLGSASRVTEYIISISSTERKMYPTFTAI